MKKADDLFHLLHSIDGKKYGMYKQLKGTYQFDSYQLAVDHVQVDPFAPPSKMRIIMDHETTGIPRDLINSKMKAMAVADFLTRAVSHQVYLFNKSAKGGGTNGKVLLDRCGQEMMERTAVVINSEGLEVRLEVGLPAAGRKILGTSAARLFEKMLPKVIEQALHYRQLDQKALHKQVTLVVDQVYIREELAQRNLVAFVANDSILPRKSGVSDQPLPDAVPFVSPKRMEVEMKLPSGKVVTGMGLPEGISLIVGGGYHGKSTLLEALERGVYHHIAGDGRELVITSADAVKIRAEDGRHIEQVNISPFINNLPGEKDTQRFTTENASGSTSQAANVVEALEAESPLLLIDEDTSATNFMIRDGRMQQLIAPEKEPITPFASKVKPLYDNLDVSTILIVGGSGDYFDVADHVLMMDEYRLKDVTEEAKDIANMAGYQRAHVTDQEFGELSRRIPLKESFSKKGKEDRIQSKGKHTIRYGKESIDLSGLDQLVDDSQTAAIAMMMDFFKKEVLDEQLSLSQAADRIYQHIEQHGLDSISPFQGHPGNMALPRKQEFCAALNRYRGLKTRAVMGKE